MSGDFDITKKFLDATTETVNTINNRVIAAQRIINGLSFTPPTLHNLQAQINAISDTMFVTIQEVQTLCNMMQDILEKESQLSSDQQKDAQPVADDFKNLEGVL